MTGRDPGPTNAGAGHAAEPLFRWIWRSYVRAALVPLVAVELLLVAAYLLTNAYIRAANIETLRRTASADLVPMIEAEANVLDERLQAVARLTEVFRRATARAYATPHDPGPAETGRYATSPQGVWHTATDNGGAALFYSAVTPVGDAERAKAWQMAQLDPLMAQIRDADPLVVQIYLNTHDSMNRIYPYFDVAAQYDPKLDIPQYNFYYGADAAHNPARGVVWTDVYVDPAGQGWMVSAIAPVYRDDFLEGVVGLDITVGTMVQQVTDLEIPWGGYGLLVDRAGLILAMPAQAERDLGLTELTGHHYAEAIRQETFKPDAYNLHKRPGLAPLAESIAGSASGIAPVNLGGAKLAAWSTIENTGWKLLAIVPEANIYAEVNALADRFRRVGYWMLGGLLVFYLLFFAFLWTRARALARFLAGPLEEYGRLAARIGAGEYAQALPAFPVHEIAQSGEALVAMGRRLGEINEALVQARDDAERASRAKSEFLSRMSHELRTPMNAILGFAQLLDMDRAALGSRHGEYVGHILDSGAHLLGLIDEVLDLARIEAGRMELRRERVDAGAVLGECVTLVEPLARKRAIDVTLATDGDLALDTDPQRLRQVVLNLLSNAVKYNRDGGSIRLRARRQPGPPATLLIEVQDTGRGIAGADLSRLFRPFERIDEDHRIEGTGVGLAVCGQLVQLMGGTIGVDSEPGVGSTFRVELPAA